MTDEEQIRRTLAEFNLASDERRWSDVGELFTEDAVLNDLVTREGIVTFLSTIRQRECDLMQIERKHTNPNIVINIKGDEADVECDLLQYDRFGGPYFVRTGKYVDHLIKRGNRWLFTSRQQTIFQRRPGVKLPD